MLNGTISKMILNALTKGQGSAQLITTQAYLALLTTLPNDAGTGAVEVDPTQMKGYSRLFIGGGGTSQKSLDQKDFFSGTGAAWSSTDNAYKIENQANMQMSAIEDGVTASAEVVGFAICNALTGTLSSTMLAWGKLINAETQQPTSVTLTKGSVPIFYYNSVTHKGDFTLLLGAEQSSTNTSNAEE